MYQLPPSTYITANPDTVFIERKETPNGLALTTSNAGLSGHPMMYVTTSGTAVTASGASGSIVRSYELHFAEPERVINPVIDTTANYRTDNQKITLEVGSK